MFDTLTSEPISESIRIKIADLGNACWTHHHFATEIQTRQYRSPEVIIGAAYDTSADMWSFACMIFEMLTGDFLFQPRKVQLAFQQDAVYSKNEDHLAQMAELFKKFPKKFSLSGSKSKVIFLYLVLLQFKRKLQKYSIIATLVIKQNSSMQVYF